MKSKKQKANKEKKNKIMNILRRQVGKVKTKSRREQLVDLWHLPIQCFNLIDWTFMCYIGLENVTLVDHSY